MDALVAFTLVAAVASLTWLAFDSKMRKDALAKITKTEADIKDTLEKVSGVNNALAKTVQAMQDQLAGHELRLAGRSDTGSTRGVFSNPSGR